MKNTCLDQYVFLRLLSNYIPSDVVPLSLIPDSVGVRVENGRDVDVALLHLSNWHCSGELEEHAQEREEDDEELGENTGGGLRTHNCEECTGS